MSACRECGGDVPTFEWLGERVEPDVCADCEPIVSAREEAPQRAEALQRALTRAGATAKLRGWSLASYLAGDPPGSAQALATARGWLRAYREGARRNLWLHGPVAAGKSGLAWGLVRDLAEEAVAAHFARPRDQRPETVRIPALFLIWRDLLDDLKGQQYNERRGGGDASALLDRARSVEVLALDDLGAERPTPYALEQLASLVERRWQAERPTIVTSNYGSRELGARLGADDPLIGERIASRLLDGAVGCRLDGPSRRRAAT